MSASAESALSGALVYAQARRMLLSKAVDEERQATVAFMDEALHNGWSWGRIGGALSVSATGARRYYERNRRRVRTL